MTIRTARDGGATWIALAWIVLVLSLALLAVGCGARKEAQHDHEEHDHDHAGEETHAHEDHAGHDHEEGEGRRVVLAAAAIERAGIRTDTARAAEIATSIETPGEVRLNEERVLHVRPRFGGLVRALPHRLGDAVSSGDTLAVIQGNESLTDFAVTAAQSGTVIARGAAVGETVTPETVLATVADFSSVWVDFAIYPQNAARVRRGQKVVVHSTSGDDRKQESTIAYVGPLLEQDTRVSYGRVVLSNRDGFWRPGLFVTVRVLVDEAKVTVAVPEDAVVRSKDGPAVFLAEGDGAFTLQPVALGRSDGMLAEITSGLAAGQVVVVENAFLLKAELGKSEAHHDH
jgi:cobalt-zinc-cadmium efflux system membrane fusion protein